MRTPPYIDAVAAFVRGTRDASACIERAAAADARGIHGPLLKTALAVCSKDRSAFATLDACRHAVRRLAMSPWERDHFEAAHAWRCGEPRRALDCYSAMATNDPLDLLAIRLAQSCAFYLGDEEALLAVTMRALPAWEEGMRGMDALLAMHAFALDENGDVEAAEACARRALDLEADNPAAIHAVAHVLATRGWAVQGADWLESHARVWRIGSPVSGHLAWHLAALHLERERGFMRSPDVVVGDGASPLAAWRPETRRGFSRFPEIGEREGACPLAEWQLQRGQPVRALVLYDSLLAPRAHHTPGELADAAGLLWRMELSAASAGDRWQALATAFARRSPPFLWPLLDVHAAAAFAFAGRDRALRGLAAALEREAEAGAHKAEVTMSVTLPLIRQLEVMNGLRQHGFAAPDLSASDNVAALGGSRLQREVVERTLGVAEPTTAVNDAEASYARAA